MSLLVTAFKGRYNSSYQLATEFNCDKLFLTNSYDGIDTDINKFEFGSYHVAVMFGLDKNLRNMLRIEPCALLDGNILATKCSISALVAEFQRYCLEIAVAENTTAYLCNYAYYKMFEIMSGNALFIHIPPQKYLNDDIKSIIKDVVYTIFS